MNKFNYYLHLRSLGIKEKHAVKMAKQATSEARLNGAEYNSADDAINFFAIWSQTEEGEDYWDDVYQKYDRFK